MLHTCPCMLQQLLWVHSFVGILLFWGLDCSKTSLWIRATSCSKPPLEICHFKTGSAVLSGLANSISSGSLKGILGAVGTGVVCLIRHMSESGSCDLYISWHFDCLWHERPAVLTPPACHTAAETHSAHTQRFLKINQHPGIWPSKSQRRFIVRAPAPSAGWSRVI